MPMFKKEFWKDFRPFIAGVIIGGIFGWMYGFDSASQRYIEENMELRKKLEELEPKATD